MEARSKSSIMVHRPFAETLTVLLRMLIRREPVGFPLISTLEDFIPETRCYQWILLTITDTMTVADNIADTDCLHNMLTFKHTL